MKYVVIEKYQVEAASPQELAARILRYQTDRAYRREQKLRREKMWGPAVRHDVVCVEEVPDEPQAEVKPLSRGRLIVELAAARESGTDSPVYVGLQLGEAVRVVTGVDEIATGLTLLTKVLP